MYTEPMDRRDQLRVKLKSLAAEAVIIRQEEHRARYCRRPETRGADSELETRPRKRENPWRYAALRTHRVLVVRRWARLTHLAYGAIRGLPLERMEGPDSVPLTVDDKKEIQRMFKTYGTYGLEMPDWMKIERGTITVISSPSMTKAAA